MPKFKPGDIIKTHDGKLSMRIDSLDHEKYYYTFVHDVECPDSVGTSYRFRFKEVEDQACRIINYNSIWNYINA